MTQSQFSLSWSAHSANICNGLSALQQNGDFVDMTLAADGHHVKVHQVIMALASPYIKELISTAQCPHPVIFLNKISSKTLSAILEYIYTGETLVPVDNLSELIDAGKELHIKGLENMNYDSRLKPRFIQPNILYEKESTQIKENEQDSDYYFEVTDTKVGDKYMMYTDTKKNKEDNADETIHDHRYDESLQAQEDMQTDVGEEMTELGMDIPPETKSDIMTLNTENPVNKKKSSNSDYGVMQYTVSNQGSLQLILNRFVYYLKHTKRCGMRQWRCVDYLTNSRCPALLVTKDDMVLQRVGVHMHTFHDKKILKKVKAGAVFTAIHEAIEEGNTKKADKNTAPSEGPHSD